MTKLHHEIKINAPVEKVWQVLANLEAVQHYNPLVKGAHYVSPNKEGVGATRYCDFKPKGFSKERVIEWKPKEVLGLEIAESSWPMKFSRWWTRLKPEAGGTLVTQDLEYEVKWGVIGKIMNALMMRGKLDKVVAEVFQGLKQFVEKQ